MFLDFCKKMDKSLVKANPRTFSNVLDFGILDWLVVCTAAEFIFKVAKNYVKITKIATRESA